MLAYSFLVHATTAKKELSPKNKELTSDNEEPGTNDKEPTFQLDVETSRLDAPTIVIDATTTQLDVFNSANDVETLVFDAKGQFGLAERLLDVVNGFREPFPRVKGLLTAQYPVKATDACCWQTVLQTSLLRR